jgi:putative membrane protein
MMFDGGWGFMAFGWIFMVLFWVFLIAGAVWLVLTVTGQAGRRQADDRGSAERILDERLARGEIDVDEYKARKAAIGGGR